MLLFFTYLYYFLSIFPQLRSLVERSVEEFVSLFDLCNNHRLPLFRMDLTFDDEKMEFYPSFQDLEEAVLQIIKQITLTMQVRMGENTME